MSATAPLPETRRERLAALERRYDGPIPEPERLAAELGAPALALLLAAGNARFFRCMVRQQVATIRRRRAEGSFYPALIDDLLLYRACWRIWHRRRLASADIAAR